tara:strand:- start:32 stop:424 length:393 start_codon:yes stop_codon:yes gene_type:complete
MKLIQGGRKKPAINDQDWKFIKTSLRQCIATQFISESEKEEILNYLETTEEVDLTVRGLMAGSQSVTSFVLSLLQAANVKRDLKRQWQGASSINADHPPLQAEYEEGAFAFSNKKRRRKASEFKNGENEK